MNKKIIVPILLIVAVILIVVLIMCTRKEPAQNVLKIGCITVMSGSGATYGRETQQGLDLAIEEANASGILGAKTIKIIYEDSQLDAKVGTQAINKLINVERVPIIIGEFSSRVTLAIAPIAERNKTVLLSASATADAIKDAGDYIFRIVPPNRAQGTTAAKFAFGNLSKKKAAVFYVNDEYGVSLAAEFKKAFVSLGGEIVFDEAFDPSERDFRTALHKIKITEPEIVFSPGQYTETGLILRQAIETGLHAIFIGGDGSYSPDLVKIAGSAAEGSYYTMMAMGFGVSDEEIRTFEERFKSKYNEEPGVYTAYAYEAGRIVAHVLARTEFNAESIKNALYQLKDFKGVTGYTTFDKFGEVEKEFYVYVVKAGKFVLAK